MTRRTFFIALGVAAVIVVAFLIICTWYLGSTTDPSPVWINPTGSAS